MQLPSLNIGNFSRPLPIVQGGMGVGVSLSRLASAVSAQGGLGTLSSAALDRLVGKALGKKVSTREAAAIEVEKSKEAGDPVAINIMVALESTYEASVMGALDGRVDAIVSGAGLPLALPALAKEHPNGKNTALIPIVSSGRALRIICKRWEKLGRIPDAVVVEGPLAGGHLGWKSLDDIFSPNSSLENLLAECLEVASEYGNFPVIVAGGIYTHEDIAKFIKMGASGVQMGTRFLATEESGASDSFKKAVVDCTPEDILIATEPGSPCGLPFRVLNSSPMFLETLKGMHKTICDKGYAMLGGKCNARDLPEKFFCICNGLLSSCGYNPDKEPQLYTVGALAGMIDRVTSVADLMKELCGQATSPNPTA